MFFVSPNTNPKVIRTVHSSHSCCTLLVVSYTLHFVAIIIYHDGWRSILAWKMLLAEHFLREKTGGIIKQFAMILQNVLPFGVQKGLIQLILSCFCFLGDWHVRANGLVLCSMTYIACRNLWDNVFVAGYSADCTHTVPIPGPSWIYRFSKWNHGGVPNHWGWTMGQGLAKLDEGGLESMYWIQLES